MRWREGARRLFTLCNNAVSMGGLFVVALALLLWITFALFIFASEPVNPYFDIAGYLILPGVFVVGLAIVPLGVLWKLRRIRSVAQGAPLPRHVHVNLSDSSTRSALAVFASLTFFVVVPALVVSSYEGYHYTESTAFCANACHSVMEPQGTAHASSPHANVTCAECHIGSGAGWFVKSKLSGTRQVLAVWGNTFPRPIPPAITELRPARETCEQCHWPAKFFGSQLKEMVHYAPDEANTRRVVRMLLNTGGADESIGRVEGIHMHMMVSGRIEYVARDPHLQDIPWVRYVRPDGTTTVYRSDGLAHDAPAPEGVTRTVDCMDCHNRGAHHFRSPQAAVDLQLEAGRIDATLPFIKREAVAALVQPYPDSSAAEQGIEEALTRFYQRNHTETWETRGDAVRQAVREVQQAYRRNFFPGMKLTWRSYPENIGHMISSGCFRCHDGLHVDAEGRAITSDCTACHTFLNLIDGRPNEYHEGEFQHSMRLGQHQELRCDQCHSGGPLPLCLECHSNMRGLAEWRDFPRFKRQGD